MTTPSNTDVTDLVAVPLEELDERYGELRLVRPSQVEAMRKSMSRFGQLMPVVASPGDGRLVLVDGFKRLEAARVLGRPELTVQRVELSEQAALAAVYHFNRSGAGLNAYEEALVIERLVHDHGMSQVEVAALLDRHKSWVCRRLSLVTQLSEDVRDDLRVGLVSVTVARDVARLPRGNQPEVVEAIYNSALNTREATRFVELFEQTPGRTQQRQLLDNARDALDADGRARALASIAPDVRLGALVNRLRRMLLQTHGQVTRLTLAITRVRPAGWTATESEVVSPLVRQTHDGIVELNVALGDLAESIDNARQADG